MSWQQCKLSVIVLKIYEAKKSCGLREGVVKWKQKSHKKKQVDAKRKEAQFE
jgi:hypothetical protein